MKTQTLCPCGRRWLVTCQTPVAGPGIKGRLHMHDITQSSHHTWSQLLMWEPGKQLHRPKFVGGCAHYGAKMSSDVNFLKLHRCRPAVGFHLGSRHLFTHSHSLINLSWHNGAIWIAEMRDPLVICHWRLKWAIAMSRILNCAHGFD